MLQPRLAADAPTVKWTPTAMLEQLGGDEALAREIVELFLVDCPGQLAHIRAAVRDRDAEEIRKAAHALKGAVSNFTSERPTTTVAELEQYGRFAQLEEASAALRQLEPEIAALMASMSASLTGAASYVS